MKQVIVIDREQTVDLGTISTREDGGLKKAAARAKTTELVERLGKLQELLYAAETHSLLVVLQGMDASGKDGAISNVFKDVNPLGVRVTPFKVPTALDRAHDFLWRIHPHTPELGSFAVFNRSQYEAVVVERVKQIVSPEVWQARYDQINDFERLLTSSQTIVVKFFLHISKEEQKSRLLKRLEDPEKAWKLNVGDWEDRGRWDEFQTAWGDAIGRCAAPGAPWYVVPSDFKWFRDLAMSEVLVDRLDPYVAGWEAELARKSAAGRTALEAARASGQISE